MSISTLSLDGLINLVATRGDAPAVLADGGDGLEALSAAALAGQSVTIARSLVARGVLPGERIGLFAPNGPEWIVARLGIGASGAVCVPIDPLAVADEVATIVHASAMTRLFVAAEQAAQLDRQTVSGLVEIVMMGGSADGAVSGHDGLVTQTLSALQADAPADVALPVLAADQPAMMVFTSGTTGRPKYFTLSYANIEANVRAISGTGLIGGNDRLLVPLPLHHVYPFVVGMLVPLATGAVIVLPEAPQGPAMVRALQRSGATMMIGVPRLYQALVAGIEAQAAARGGLAARAFPTLLALSIAARRHFNLRLGPTLFAALHSRFGGSLRLLVSAGAKLEAPVIWKIEGLGWELLTGYGLAETASAFTGNVPGAKRIGSEGKPLAGGLARIAPREGEAHGGGATAGAGDGEIELKGPSVFSGYLDNPEANAQAFTEDGWFRTGDLGSIDPDGFVYVTGRVKEMIVLGGGKNVFPEELERIYGDTPYFTEIAVLEREGDLVALIVPEIEKIRADGFASLDDVVRVTLGTKAQALASHQRLSGYAISREPLPRTRLGKYQRFLLPELYEKARRGERRTAVPAEPNEADKTLLQEPAAAATWALLKTRYADKRLDMDASPQLDLGIDSLEWLGLGMALEAATGRVLEADRLAAAETVRDLVRLVVEAPLAEADAVTGPGPLKPAKQARVEADAARWLAKPGAATRLLGHGLDRINRALMRTAFRLSVDGRANLPAHGPFLIVANHASDLDPPVLAAALPSVLLQKIYWSGDRDRLFATALSRRFCRAAHIFPVDERDPGATLAMAEAVLGDGNGLVWFPESWRSPDGRLQPFRPGIGALLARRPVPVIPAWIAGTFAALPRTRRLPRLHPVAVRFGTPIDSAALVDRANGEPTAIAAALRNAIGALAPKGN